MLENSFFKIESPLTCLAQAVSAAELAIVPASCKALVFVGFRYVRASFYSGRSMLSPGLAMARRRIESLELVGGPLPLRPAQAAPGACTSALALQLIQVLFRAGPMVLRELVRWTTGFGWGSDGPRVWGTDGPRGL